jgi:hypothetical protein
VLYAQERHHKLTSVPLPTAGQVASTDGALELDDTSVSELMSLDFSSHKNCMDADRMEIGIGAT